MAFEHASGLPSAYDRADSDSARARLVFAEDRFVQAAEMNELQSLEARRNRRTANMVAKDGDVQSGGSIVINTIAQRATLSAGTVYVAGDVRPVAAATFNSFPVTGEVVVGVKLVKALIDYTEDPTLLGLQPGSEAEGEPGAARERETIAWAIQGDNQPGEFHAVYQVRDGVVIDNRSPPALTGVVEQVARYDFDALGHYAVGEGNVVTPLGKIGSDQVFSISDGTANITGFKRIREAAFRFVVPEEPDLETVTAEAITLSGPTGGTSTLAVARAPIASITSVVIPRQTSQTVTRGLVTGGSDALTFSSVVQIVSVVQGPTTYVAGADYTLASGAVSWAPAGAEPAASSTYTVTYIYNDAATPAAITDTTFEVTGGVNGMQALVTYQSKLPRTDLIGLDVTGRPVYVKGVSARANRLAPLPPTSILKLAEVDNTWLGTPTVRNNGPRNYTFETQGRFFGRLIDILDSFDRANAERDIVTREPVAKRGIFTDNFVDDFYRDQGAAQTAAIVQGSLQLAVDAITIQRFNNLTTTLNFTEEVVLRQELATSSMLINPYDNFTPFPAGLKLEPAADFWTEVVTSWTSDVTREFQTAPNVPPGTTTITEVTELRRTVAPSLRQISVQATLEGFGAGENLSTLTFDGINVKPPGTQTANGSGILTVSFTIPAGIPVGTRAVRATGAAGSFAQAIFVGEGTVDQVTMRRVHLVTREAPPPVNVTNIAVINQVVQPIVNDWAADANAGFFDPLAQSFALPEDRMIVGLDFKFAAIGNRQNGVRIQLSPMANGMPSNEVMAEAFVSMQTPVVGEWVQARFAAPVHVSALRQYCFVILTADPDHAVSVSKLGDVYSLPGGGQARVSAQPYTVGVLFASANRQSWTPIQEADLTMRVVAAAFTSPRAVTLGTVALTNISDLLVRGTIELPTPDARLRFEIVRADNSVIPVQPGQNVPLAAFITETVTVRAVLQGSSKISPILYPGTLFVGGRIRTTGTYITRLFPMGTAVRVSAILSTFLPAGSTVALDVDVNGNGVWSSLTAGTSDALGSNWFDSKFDRNSHTAANGRIRISITGSPAARPSFARLRAYSI